MTDCPGPECSQYKNLMKMVINPILERIKPIAEFSAFLKMFKFLFVPVVLALLVGNLGYLMAIQKDASKVSVIAQELTDHKESSGKEIDDLKKKVNANHMEFEVFRTQHKMLSPEVEKQIWE